MPQYLNVGYMTENFVRTLSKGEKLKQFINACKKNQKDAQDLREERKKFIRKQLIQAKYDQRSFKSNVYLCWLLVWSSSFKYHLQEETIPLTKQAKQVLQRMFKFDTEVTEQIELMM